MQDKDYLKRCIELAKLGGKATRPNPQVGSIIVYKERIIGEGFHKKYGGPHAEVNAVNSVSESDKQYLPFSTIYVTLEPCCHHGNTPPCTDLILKNKIPRVCIAEIDPTEKVNSKGISQLEQNGIEVEVIPIDTQGVLAEFRVNQLKKRPFVQLKLAKSKDNYIGKVSEQIWLSNDISNTLTHKFRAYTDAILIGTNTALVDNPSLTLRNYRGIAPKRIVLDRQGRIPTTHTLLADALPCIIITEQKRNLQNEAKEQIVMDFSKEDFVSHLLSVLYNMGIYHIIVEGGASLHNSFLKSRQWDEAVIINTPKQLYNGIKAPNLYGKRISKYQLGEDEVLVIANTNE